MKKNGFTFWAFLVLVLVLATVNCASVSGSRTPPEYESLPAEGNVPNFIIGTWFDESDPNHHYTFYKDGTGEHIKYKTRDDIEPEYIKKFHYRMDGKTFGFLDQDYSTLVRPYAVSSYFFPNDTLRFPEVTYQPSDGRFLRYSSWSLCKTL